MKSSLWIRNFYFVFCLSLLLIASPSFATLIQILHTNDIHSHLEHSPHQPDLGGYAQLKVQLAGLRQWGEERGIGTIAMDAGDFLEGNIFYLADRGKKAYQIHGQVGFDVATIGNHDYLMGARDLEPIMRDVSTSFQLLGANFHVDKKYKAINSKIKPYWETVVNGVKVGVVGPTLNDVLYKWRIEEGDISDEIEATQKYARELRARGNQVVIALTHVGLSKDRKIAKNVPEVDFIVGGHSHDRLFSVEYVKSKGNKRIGIVQAGNHLEWMGQLILDYDPLNKSVRVASYQLIPVKAPYKDPDIEARIADANDALDVLFGAGWLTDIVGISKLKTPQMGGNKLVWQFLLNDAIREAVDGDFAVNAEALAGTNYPTNKDITRRDLYNSNPRTFEFDRKYGYNVYTARVRGLWISLVFRVVMRLGLPLYVSGITFDAQPAGDGKYGEKYKVSNLRVNGKRIKLPKLYKVALPEAIVRGGFAITQWVGLLLKFPDDYKISMWQALENKVRQLRIVQEDYLDRYFFKQDGVMLKPERVYLP
ncbi:MAG: metallophosphoesterase [Bdellovibrionota bacterium]